MNDDKPAVSAQGGLLRPEAIERARHRAANSLTLARAILGDATVLDIVNQFAGQPNNRATRAKITAAISRALKAKMADVTKPKPWSPPATKLDSGA